MPTIITDPGDIALLKLGKTEHIKTKLEPDEGFLLDIVGGKLYLSSVGGLIDVCPTAPSNNPFTLDFDFANTSYANGAPIDGVSDGVGTARRSAGSTTQIASNEGRIVTPLASDHGYFTHNRDLNTVRGGAAAGTWLIDFFQRSHLPFNSSFWPVLIHRNAEPTGSGTFAQVFGVDISVSILQFGSGLDGFGLFYSDGANSVNAGSSTAAGNQDGVLLHHQLEKRGAPNNDYIARFDIDGDLPTTIGPFTIAQASVPGSSDPEFIVLGNATNSQAVAGGMEWPIVVVT